MALSKKFEENIIYRARQHWIILVLHVIKLSLFIGIPMAIAVLLFSDWIYAGVIFMVVFICVVVYEYFLYAKSWLFVGNQKITLFVRNGLFSQYAMSIRYGNIQDCACSKNSMLGYWFWYGTFFARSISGKEWEHFQANFVPKVGKVYSIVNALAELSDAQRVNIENLDQLFSIHKKEEPVSVDPIIEGRRRLLASIPGVVEVAVLSRTDCEYIKKHEARENEWVLRVIESETVFALTHDSSFRDPDAQITEIRDNDIVYFPVVPFHELWPTAISGSPGVRIHAYLIPKFKEITIEYATVVVGV